MAAVLGISCAFAGVTCSWPVEGVAGSSLVGDRAAEAGGGGSAAGGRGCPP